MARTDRTNVDYFPFLCKEGATMFYIETKFGNDGYATWIKILRELAVANHHYIDLSTKPKIMHLSAKCKVNEDKLLEIIDALCLLEEFKKDVWDEFKIIWSDKFIENIQDAYKRRLNKCITFEQLMYTLKGIKYTEITKTPEKENRNTHIILDNSIQEKNIGYYFKIQEKIYPIKVSEYLEKNCIIFLNETDIVKKFPPRAEIFEKINVKYAQYKFSDENHIRMVYAKYKENGLSEQKSNKVVITGEKKNFSNEQL